MIKTVWIFIIPFYKGLDKTDKEIMASAIERYEDMFFIIGIIGIIDRYDCTQLLLSHW